MTKNCHFRWTPSHENFWIRACFDLYVYISSETLEKVKDAVESHVDDHHHDDDGHGHDHEHKKKRSIEDLKEAAEKGLGEYVK